MADTTRRGYLFALAFVSGACVMTVEMAGQRALVPHFGSSTYVWTNIIGVILAALSVGYLLGGRIADRAPDARILLGVVAAASLLCMLVPVVVHPLAEALIPAGTRQESAFRLVYLGSFLVTLLLLAPPIFLLGMVSPFTIRLLTREAGEVGRSSGTVYALSTVGSIVGTFLPTLVLIPSLGTARTILAAAGSLCLFAVAGFGLFAAKRRAAAAALLVPLLPALLLSGMPAKGGGDALEERESRMQYIRVLERGDTRILSLNEGLQTYHSLTVRGRALTGASHFDYFNLVPLHFDPALRPRLRVYVAGLAAGTVSRQLHHFFGETFRLEVDGAEIDAAVLDTGRRHFALGPPGHRNLRAMAADGRVALAEAGEPYDIVLVDAYANQMYIPHQLASVEFFARVKARLAPGGIACINVADFTPEGPLLTALKNTMASVFGTVVQVRIPAAVNYFLYAAREGEPSEDILQAGLRRASFLSRPEAPQLVDLLRYAVHARTVHRADPGTRLLTDDHAPLEALMDAAFRKARTRQADMEWPDP